MAVSFDNKQGALLANCVQDSHSLGSGQRKKLQSYGKVGICIDFHDFTFPCTPYFLFRLRRYIKNSRQCFIGYPNTSDFVENTPLRVVYSTLYSVFGVIC